MNDENYWKQFIRSGSVQDYLAYAGESRQKKEAPREEGVSGTGGEYAREGKNKGEYPYAGFYYGDRDGLEPDSCR
ncbi:MAG: hypothetical protein K2I01_03500 [Lachnospiraceae bacterium]|nr:hypothetical protein [Lachnospiraceae bacterium]